MSQSIILAFILWFINVAANVEKVIFVASGPEPSPTDASIDNLLLTPLSESYPSVRTYLNASFPTKSSTRGSESWLLLDGLVPHRRYEVRVCWLATQPTSFWLDTHLPDTVFQSPELISSLSTYSYARHGQLDAQDIGKLQARKFALDPGRNSTYLFLQIFAAADYFSLNQTLMDHVPPVIVDVILDPYVLNIFPRSLIPTGLYLVGIAVIAWFASGFIARQFMVSTDDPSKSVRSKKSHEL